MSYQGQGYPYGQPAYPQLPPGVGDPFLSQQVNPYSTAPWGTVAAPPSGAANIFGAHAQQQPQQMQVQPQFQQPQQTPAAHIPGQLQTPASAYGYQRAPYSYPPPSALQPQQLESVTKDEDPVYGPVGRARGKIDRALTGDAEISPELAETLVHCELLQAVVS